MSMTCKHCGKPITKGAGGTYFHEDRPGHLVRAHQPTPRAAAKTPDPKFREDRPGHFTRED